MTPGFRSSLIAASVFAVFSSVAAAGTVRMVPIAYAAEHTPDGHAIHEGEVVSVSGTANIASNALYDNLVKFFIEDDSAGIAIFSRAQIATVRPGDVVRITGKITTYNGAIEIIATECELLSRGRMPTPQFVRPSDIIGGRYYGRLVRTQGEVIEASGRWRAFEARIHAGRELLTVRLTDLQRKTIPAMRVGETVSVIGIPSVYSAGNPPRVTWEIIPRIASDIQVVEAPPLVSHSDALKVAAGAAGVLIVILLWNASLRLRVRREMREHRESEGRFSAVAQTAPVAIFIYQDTVFRYVNEAAEEITGYAVGELIGRKFWDIVDPDFQELIRTRGQARLRGESVASRYEFPIVRKDGRRAWLDFSATEIRYEGSVAALGTAFDITERKLSEEKLQASERRFRALVEHASDAIALFDPKGRVTWVGPSTQRILGIDDQDLIGTDASQVLHPDDQPAVRHAFASVAHGPLGESAEVAYRLRVGSGEWCWFEATVTNLLEEESVRAVVVNYRDISERKRAEEEMRHQALHDTLTGLPNRSLYHDRLGLALAHARRSGKTLAVMFVDLDLFKLVNDSAGHVSGDAVLREAGQRLLACVRSSDTVARVGGDEFTVIVEDVGDVESVTRIADSVLEAVAKPYAVDQRELHVTASIGISIFPADGNDADTLTRNADKAMYRAKELGRHNVQLFTADMNERYRARIAFEAGFSSALDRDEFVVHYQPIQSASGATLGVEALVRWNDPRRGLVYPDDFIPAAEETRMIVPLGAYVLQSACSQVARWSREGLAPLSVSVNLSVRQFHQRHLLKTIDDVLRETGLDPQRLILEITESVAMQNVDVTRSILQQLRARGIRIAIDDFGAGHTSLMYLRQFPINSIKIDRLFVKHATVADAAIVTAIIRLAHNLGLTVTAEGVETEEQRQFLIAEQCDLLQGYLLGRPVTADELRPMLPLADVPDLTAPATSTGGRDRSPVGTHPENA